MKYTDIITLVLSELGTNCYIVPVGDGEAVVIDPAADGKKIYGALTDAGLAVKKILLTHGHFDHTAGTAELKKLVQEKDGYEFPVFLHEADKEMTGDPVKSLSFFCQRTPFVACEPTDIVKDGDVITQGSVTFTVLHTPGHTAGSVCFLCEDEDGNQVMFAGDTIFKDSIGRSDTYSGNPSVQLDTLDKLRSLKGDYIIFPGHGPSTTLDAERRYNPFLSDL